MNGEDNPPGYSSPPSAGASNAVSLSVGQRAVWIKPSSWAPNGANPNSGQSAGWASPKRTRNQT